MDPSLNLRDWSNLPGDIVRNIMGKVFWSDRIRMRAVCKNWLPISHHGLPIIDQEDPTWIMVFDGSACMLEDSSLKKRAFFGVPERGMFEGVSVQTCRYGWVLFRKFQEENQTNTCYGFFLYSPFTNELVQLPDLFFTRPILPCSLVATFHLSSSNPDCLVFCLHRDEEKETVIINTCRPGDVRWTTHHFQASNADYSGHVPNDHRPNHPLSAIYVDGSFYCVFARGQLGSFDARLRQWTLLVNTWWPYPVIQPPELLTYFTSADLIAIPGPPATLVYKASLIFKCDFSSKHWRMRMNGSEFRLSSLYGFANIGDDEIFLKHVASDSADQPTTNMPPFDLYAFINIKPPKCSTLIEPPYRGMWTRRDLLQYNCSSSN